MTTLFVPEGRFVAFVSTSVPFIYVFTDTHLSYMILILFQLVIVAVNAPPDDAVVPSAVLIRKEVDTAFPAHNMALLTTDVKSVQPVVTEESANPTSTYLFADGMDEGTFI